MNDMREIIKGWARSMITASHCNNLHDDEFEEYISEFLSLETKTHRIAVIKKSGELPEYDFTDTPTFFESGYNIAQQDMLTAGYVQEV